MFEIIQHDNSVLRFDDNYFYEIEGKYVKVFQEKDCDVIHITTVFYPIREDKVSMNSHLSAPVYTLRDNLICKYCFRKH